MRIQEAKHTATAALDGGSFELDVQDRAGQDPMREVVRDGDNQKQHNRHDHGAKNPSKKPSQHSLLRTCKFKFRFKWEMRHVIEPISLRTATR